MRAEKVFRSISPKILKNYKISIEETLVEAGSGTLPSVKFESVAFRIASNKYSASKLSERFRNATHPVVGFIKNDNFHLDFKSIIPFQEKFLMLTITEVLD